MSSLIANSSADGGDRDVTIASRLHPSDVADRIAVMRNQEETTYRCYDYFSCGGFGDEQATEEAMMPHEPPARPQQQQEQPPSKQQSVDAECRVKMVEWCAQVIDFCKFSRETVGIGMSYLDRYVATTCSGTTHHPGGGARRAVLSDRKEYQLYAMTCLYMAIKLHEPLEMETKLLSDLSRGCYTTAEIAATEREVLQALQWRVAGPTPLGFVRHFLAVGLHETTASSYPAIEATLLDFSRFQTELAIGLPSLVPTPPSKVALASVLNSMEALDEDTFDPFERTAFLENVITASKGLDPTTDEMRHIRRLLSASFVENSGYDLAEVASRLSLGRKSKADKKKGGAKKMSNSSEGSSSPEVSPVCVSRGITPTKKQRHV